MSTTNGRTRPNASPSTNGAAGIDPLSLLSGLVLDTGQTWGETALPWQHDDAAAILTTDPEHPRRHYMMRGRGMSKTTDVAALTLALLLTLAPQRSRSHAYAVDADQARILVDTIGGLVARSGLGGLVEVAPRSVTVRSTGATLTIESSDGASAYGLRPWLTVCDELSMWPATANHRSLWAAIVSAVPKVDGARLVAIGTAGSPTSLGAEVWAEATTSRHWRTSRVPGPAPWWDAADVEAVGASLSPAEYRRLILCEWAQGDDALTTPEDVAACVRPGSAVLAPRRGLVYVAALDVGTRRDLTGLAVGHSERRASGRVVVIDRVMSWRPRDGAGGRVDLADVEAATLRLCREYRVTRLRFDRMQAEQLTGNLARSGVRTDEFVFSSAGADRLARALFVSLRDRAIDLPDDPELVTEAATVRMVETGPGTVRMTNPAGTHDDVLTAVGMVAADLTSGADTGGLGRITIPHRAGRPRSAQAPRRRPTEAGVPSPDTRALRDAARAPGKHAGAALLVPGSANDPARERR